MEFQSQRKFQDKKARETDREEYAIVLDFLPNGYPFDTRPSYLKKPIAQAIGKKNLALLELVPKKDVFLQPHEQVYIGEGKRDKIHHVSSMISYDKLTATAKNELQYAIEQIVKEREKDFVEFFNKAKPLTTRMHSLELLPGLGKKRMWELIEARDEKPFESFEDMRTRIKQLPDVVEMLTKRIIIELSEPEKHRLFVKYKRE
ncbi:MAG: putative nucleotide binding protein [Candidatus Woesearchaeota archaeon]|nr:putative nucleotide binding protein [Candidatus Woesearchaeota archaeon]